MTEARSTAGVSQQDFPRSPHRKKAPRDGKHPHGSCSWEGALFLNLVPWRSLRGSLSCSAQDMLVRIILYSEEVTHSERNPTPHSIFLNSQDTGISWLGVADSQSAPFRGLSKGTAFQGHPFLQLSRSFWNLFGKKPLTSLHALLYLCFGSPIPNFSPNYPIPAFGCPRWRLKTKACSLELA